MKATTQATNHPRPGSRLVIEPLRSIEDVQRVAAKIRNPRDLAIFRLGVNSNLRASDLLSLRCSNIDWDRGEIQLREKKTGKPRHFAIAPPVFDLLAPLRGADDDYLFRSAKTGGKLEVATLNHMVKTWCFRAGIRGNFGSHTLRKTWAAIQYGVFKQDLAMISRELNHSSMSTTYRYIGIIPDQVRAMYLNVI